MMASELEFQLTPMVEFGFQDLHHETDERELLD